MKIIQIIVVLALVGLLCDASHVRMAEKDRLGEQKSLVTQKKTLRVAQKSSLDPAGLIVGVAAGLLVEFAKLAMQSFYEYLKKNPEPKKDDGVTVVQTVDYIDPVLEDIENKKMPTKEYCEILPMEMYKVKRHYFRSVT